MGKEAAEAQAVGQRLPSERCAALFVYDMRFSSLPPRSAGGLWLFGSLNYFLYCIVGSGLFVWSVCTLQPTNKPKEKRRE